MSTRIPREELIDLILGELEPARDAEVRRRLAADPALAAELAELEALFGFMRRGEEIDADRAVHETVMAEARRVARPPLAKRLASLPSLFGFRFRRSRVFRVAVVSLGVHVVAMLVLLQFMVTRSGNTTTAIFDTKSVAEAPIPDVRPNEAFAFRLSLARASRSARLREWGVDGQRDAIRQGVDRLLARQRPDGSFGDLAATSRAALVLLTEGVTSTDDTRRGRALHRAIDVVCRQVDTGGRDETALMALVENWALGYAKLTREERTAQLRAIHALVQSAPGEEEYAEGLYWAAQAGYPVDAPASLPDTAAVRIATLHESGERVAENPYRDAFRTALAPARNGDAQALLTLQAPYRL